MGSEIEALGVPCGAAVSIVGSGATWRMGLGFCV